MKRGGELARTPMAPRAKEMSRGKGFQRTPVAAMKRTPAKRKAPRNTGFSAEDKLAIRTRAGNGDPNQARCEATGERLGRYGGEIQHRNARRIGGSKLRNNIANGALLASPVHRLAESRDEALHAAGFWLYSWEDPMEVPILLHGLKRFRLDDFGTYQDDAPAGAA